MIYSALFVLLITSLANGLPDSYFDSLSNFSGWISSQSHSENETENVEEDEIPNDPVRRVIGESETDVQVVNPDKPMPVGDLLDKFRNEAPKTSVDEKKEIMGVLQQLRNAVYDESLRNVKVLYKGFWHAVDLGIVGSSQRKRDAEKADGILESVKRLWNAIWKTIFGWFGYNDDDEKKNDDDDDDDEKDKNGDKADKEKDKIGKDLDNEKDKEKNKDKNRDGTDKSKKIGGDNTAPLVKDDKSDDSSDKVDVVLKPLADSKDTGPNAHTSSNGKLLFDTKWQEGVGGAVKNLSELSALLGDKLMTREEVDHELKEAEKNKDFDNRFYQQVRNAKRVMQQEKDEREWTEKQVLDKLDEMNRDFDKTADKTQMVKDTISFSMQPLYYAETYDKIMDMVDRLKESNIPDSEKLKLLPVRDFLFDHKRFSLHYSIQETPKKKYQAERRKKMEEIAKKEREAHKDNREWTEDKALDRIDEIDKNFDTATPDKDNNLKDLTSLCMQAPSYKVGTYNKIFELMEKLKKNKKVTEEELQTAEDALSRKSRFVYFDSLLQKSQLQEHEKFNLQKEKAKEKRDQHKDTREFTEEQALKEIDDMNKNFETKDVPVMVKDVTNLSMQPLYHVETYDKLTDLIGKLKQKNVADEQLKPAVDSLNEEKSFSSQHDLREKPKGSLAEKLQNLKEQYILPGVALNTDKKKSLFKDLQILRTEAPSTKEEYKDATSLLKAVMGDEKAVNHGEIQELYQFMNQNQKNSENKGGKSSAVPEQNNSAASTQDKSSTVYTKTTNLSTLKNPDEFDIKKALGVST